MERFERKAVIAELAILSLTLILTCLVGIGVYYQTSKHFSIQRTSYMSERFNQRELVDARQITDKWLASKEAPKALFDRALDPHSQTAESEKKDAEKLASDEAKKAEEIVKNIRVFCNFFQELGTAEKHGTMEKEYMWDLFGANVTKYGEELMPFIEELRVRRKRPQLLQQFIQLANRMRALNKEYGQ